MELRHLRYFVAVAEEMNIHQAAERLHISQPPLSVAIKQLEEEIGADLFVREGRGIKITAAGKSFLENAKNIIRAAQKASIEAKEISEGKIGKLKVGFISSSVTGVFQKIVTAHHKKFPEISLDVRQSVNQIVVNSVLNEELDVGIIRLPERVPEDVLVHEIVRESWFVALHHKSPHVKKTSFKVRDLEGLPLIFYPRWNSPVGYDDVVNLFVKHDVHFNVVQEVTEQMTVAGLVAAGVGFGIVPECMGSIKMPNIVHRPLQGTKNMTGFALVTRKKPDILVEQFVALAQSLKI